MSIVAAWWSPTAAVMAADRCMTFQGKEMMSTDDKVLVVSGADGDALLGTAGYMDYVDWWRALPSGQIAGLPHLSCLQRVERETRRFVETMRARGDGRVDDDKWHLGFEGLLACREGLFYLYGDGSMGRSPLSYGAVGTGAEVAMGAFHVLGALQSLVVYNGEPPTRSVELAVEAANAHSRGCGFGARTHALRQGEDGIWKEEE